MTGNGMGNIERCSCGKPLTECEQRMAPVIAERDDWKIAYGRARGELTATRQQLQGAVESLRELAGDAESYEPPVARMQQDARAALMRLGHTDPWRP